MGDGSIPRPQLKNLDATHREFASFQEQYVRHYISLADTKAAVLFGVVSSLVAFLASKPAFRTLILEPTSELETTLALFVSTILLLAGAFAASVIMPRMPTKGDGVIFFGAVCKRESGADYAEAVAELSDQELIHARLCHCYNVSTVCWRKYRSLRIAMWLTIIGVLLLIVTLSVAPL